MRPLTSRASGFARLNSAVSGVLLPYCCPKSTSRDLGPPPLDVVWARIGVAMPAEERKLATVLFADLVGSTELAGDEDPERVRALLDRFYDSMAVEIDQAGGTVEKFV